MYVYVQLYTVHAVCVQIFVGLYFREFRKSTGNPEKKNAKTHTHTVQVSCCMPPSVKLKLRKLLGAGRLRNIHSMKICTHTVRICNNNAYI